MAAKFGDLGRQVVAAGAYCARIGGVEFELVGVHVYGIGRIAYEAATGGGKAHRAPCRLRGECAATVGVAPRIQQAQREVATVASRHPDIATVGLEHGAGVHADMRQRCAGGHVDGAAGGGDVAIHAVNLRRFAEDRHITATGVDGLVDGDRAGISAHIFNPYITRTRRHDGLIHHQGANRTGAIAQQNGAAVAGGDASQGDFFMHQIEGIRTCQKHGATDHVQRRCTGTRGIGAVNRDTGHTTHRQAIELGQENARVGVDGLGRHRVHAQLDGIGASSHTGFSIETHRVGRDVHPLRGDIQIGIGDGVARIQADDTRHTGAGIELAQHDIARSQDAQGTAVGGNHARRGLHGDIAGSRLQVHGLARSGRGQHRGLGQGRRGVVGTQGDALARQHTDIASVGAHVCLHTHGTRFSLQQDVAHVGTRRGTLDRFGYQQVAAGEHQREHPTAATEVDTRCQVAARNLQAGGFTQIQAATGAVDGFKSGHTGLQRCDIRANAGGG